MLLMQNLVHMQKSCRVEEFKFSTEEGRKRSFDASGSGTMSGGAIGKTFNIKERDHLMVEIARMFYSAGLPFHLARNPYFVSAFSYAATHNIPGFYLPGIICLRPHYFKGRKQISTTCCNQLRALGSKMG